MAPRSLQVASALKTTGASRPMFARWLVPAVASVIPVVLMPSCCRQTQANYAELVARVEHLGEKPLELPAQLATPIPVDTDDTRYIVSHGEVADPLLVEALRSTNPRKVGWAAYCLRRLGSRPGRSAALAQRDRLRTVRTPTPDQCFALGSLTVYIETCK